MTKLEKSILTYNIAVIVLALLMVGATIYFINKVSTQIREHGLKSIAGEIWNGETNSPTKQSPHPNNPNP